MFGFGWGQAPKDSTADICIVNTCCVTHQADRKSRNAIRDTIRKNKDARVIVTGCYAQYDRARVENIDGVEAVFGNNQKDQFFAWMETLLKTKDVILSPDPVFGQRKRAFLKIQDGCNNRCSYCVVSLMRGPSKSMELTQAVRQAHHLVEAGHQEIVLTGINLGSYGKDLSQKTDLIDVIEELEKIKELERIRLSSIEASEISEELIEKMAESEKLCPHLHIPFQSGDDQVLRSMNKKLSVRDYMAIIEKARGKIKDLAITCDVIVGYPGENEKSFKNTMNFLEFITPLRTHIFTYSQRRGVKAVNKQDHLSCDVVKKRSHLLKNLSEKASIQYRSAFLNREMDVLFENKKGGVWEGYSRNYIKFHTHSNVCLSNKIVRVKLVDLRGEKTYCEIVSNDPILCNER